MDFHINIGHNLKLNIETFFKNYLFLANFGPFLGTSFYFQKITISHAFLATVQNLKKWFNSKKTQGQADEKDWTDTIL